MTAPRHPGDKPPTNAAAKGVALIALAVVVGAIFLAMGFSSDDGLFATGGPTGSTTTTVAAKGNDDEGTTNGDNQSETDSPDEGDETGEPGDNAGTVARPNNEIHYVVLNGSGAGGRAGRVSSQLSALGFVPSDPTNVPSGQVEESHIYYEEGWKLEAQAVAKALGVENEMLSALPAPFNFDMGEAHIMVVLGKDGVIKA